jgi:aminopeptidase-like protein
VTLLTDYTSEIDSYLQRLFPLCRSITGEGNRETLRILSEIVPIVQHEVPSGTQVYDWVVPDEWNIRDAWVATAEGRRIVDFKENNLHVVSYSTPINIEMPWAELKLHLHIHPELPHAIPYRTTYYKRDWGFCVTQSQYAELEKLEGPFEVVVDSELQPGSLTYGECLLPGRSSQEILISCYICHPSMTNDSLSGVLLTTFLAKHLQDMESRHWSYRIIFVPETIGAITYCSKNEKAMKQIDMGLVVTTVGGPGKVGCKQSWQKGHAINRMIEEVMSEAEQDFITYPFDIHGSDERQYSSQGFRINCVTICKDRYYEYPEYHSSLDNLDFVTGEHIALTCSLYRKVIDKIESRRVYRNLIPCGEVMLSRHDLYPVGGGAQRPELGGRSELDLILWVLFLCDGCNSLSDIAVELEVDESSLLPIVERLLQKGVLANV